MAAVAVEKVLTREALTFQFLLGISVVGCLFYFQSLVSQHERSFIAAANVFGGGTLSGGLHALSGPDHLAALLPFVLGQKWHKAAYFGSVWGLGHGLTTSLMGVFGFYVKDSLLAYRLLPQLTSLADYAVGITLIIIGIMGINESQHIIPVNKSSECCEATVTDNELDEEEIGEDDLLIDPVTSKVSSHFSILLTIFANGCFLGMSWDGLPSLAPTLAIYSWQLLFAFLAAYCVGTVATISVASGFIGESTKWLSTVTSEDLPRRLALVSSVCAISIGAVWILQAVLKLVEATDNEAAYTLSWFLCCAIALGSPVAIVGVIILTINKGTTHTDEPKTKKSSLKIDEEQESAVQDLFEEVLRPRRQLVSPPIPWDILDEDPILIA